MLHRFATETRGAVLRGALVALAALLLAATALAACGFDSANAAVACTSSDVRISAGQFGVGHGHFGGALLFRNEGSTACTLRGYPVALGLTADGGRRIAAAGTPRGYVGGLLPGRASPPTVLLAPGVAASAILEGTTREDGGACRTFRAIVVGPPGGVATTALAIETAPCTRLEVHPIVSGVTGDQSP